MHSRHTIFSGCAAGLLALLSIPTAVRAEESSVKKASWETEFSSSVIGGSKFKGDANTGNVGMWDIGGSAVLSLQAKEGVLIRLGANYHRYNFVHVPGATPFPGKLQSFNLILGADFQLGEAWLARLEIQPGFYSTSATLRGRDLNVPLALGASYFVSADLQLVAGVSMDLERKYPVLPAVGFRWKMSENWVLDAILPTPRLEYSVTKALTVYAGANFNGGSFRAEGNFGSSRGNPRADNAVVDYTQIRVGGGASWKIGPTFTLEVEGGVVPVSQLYFHRADVSFRSTGAPAYGGISLKAAY